jgi:hypothetical protein
MREVRYLAKNEHESSDTALSGSGEWKTVEIPVTSRLTEGIRICGEVVLHMVEAVL